MTTTGNHRWLGILAANAVVLGVLGLYGGVVAAPQAGQPPFANPIDQRAEMVRELREIKELLKEQNALLRSSRNKTDATALAPR